jgi:hypothetical protein
MRTKFYIAVLIVLFSGVLVGCQSVAEGTDLGTFIHYNNFAWRKYTPDTLHITLDIAENDSKQPVKLDLYKLDNKTGGYVPTGSEVQLFADGEACPGNVLTICPGDTEIVLGLVFSPDAEEKEYKWIFKVVDMGELECVNNVEMQVGTDLTTMAMKAEMKHVWNPLAKGVVIVLGIIFGLLMLWLLLIRFLWFDYFKVAKVNLGTSEKLYTKRVKGLLSLTFTAKRQQQSILERWFVGERMYVVDAFFEAGDIVIVPKNKKSVGIRGVQNYDATSTTVCVNDDPVVIKNSAKQKCEITIV